MLTYALNSGYEMPLLGLGTWKAPNDKLLYDAIRTSIKIGYRHIDCAKIYLNEETIGKALADAIKAGDVLRQELFIVSKLWNDSHRTEDVMPALKSSLKDLQLDYLDLYLIHWPVCLKKGTLLPESKNDFIPLEQLPISETWTGMQDTVREGLVRSIGVSNFSIKKLNELTEAAAIKPSVNQVECHPFFAQNKMLKYCQENNILLTAYSPLGSKDRPSGMKSDNEPSLLENKVINEIAEKHGATPAQVILKWQIQRGVCVIPKSTNASRLQENFDSPKITLDTEDINMIASLNKDIRLLTGTFFAPEGSGYTLENIWDETHITA